MRIVAAMASIKNMIIKTKKAGTTYIMCGSCLCRVVVFLLLFFPVLGLTDLACGC